ncbi:MAG TPA: hypothetical protein VN041_18325 [Microbacterium sp.]|nr:hypothetical protein [Microbacterium sp.]
MESEEEIMREMRLNGGAQRVIEDDIEAAEWRKVARAAARRLGRPVETMRAGRIVVAALKDWPGNELEHQLNQAQMRNVMERMSQHLESGS